MIRLEEVKTGRIDSLSFEIKAGSVCKIIADSEGEKKRLWDTIMGLQEPIAGRVFLFDINIYSIPEKECIRVFRRVGAVLENGGTISNIKVWENITLPVWYHLSRKPADAEDRILDIFEQMGVNLSYLQAHMGKLPGPLSLHEKRMIGLIKAMLMEPELMIYDSFFDGLSEGMVERLKKVTEDFQSEKPGRTSVYITSNELSVKDVKADTVVRV